MKEIKMIVALDRAGIVGKGNKIPWQLKRDMKTFKRLTKNNVIIMGRKTFESIGKPLPKRKNIVLTTNNAFKVDGVARASSISDAIDIAEMADGFSDIFVCGGEKVYKSFIPLANHLYVTMVDCRVEKGDAKFVYNQKQISDNVFMLKAGWKFESVIFEADSDSDNEFASTMLYFHRIN